jgi:hypothetical protein
VDTTNSVAGHSKRVDLRVDDQTYEAIQRIADQDHRRVSDRARERDFGLARPAISPQFR